MVSTVSKLSLPTFKLCSQSLYSGILIVLRSQGFARQLEDSEIYEQALLFSRELAKEGKRLSNVVFMGMCACLRLVPCAELS